MLQGVSRRLDGFGGRLGLGGLSFVRQFSARLRDHGSLSRNGLGNIEGQLRFQLGIFLQFRQRRQLIKALQALPQDINIQVMTSEGEGPNDIVQVSRGTWSNDINPEDIDEDDAIEDYQNDEEPEFIQDDETGKIAVLVTW